MTLREILDRAAQRERGDGERGGLLPDESAGFARGLDCCLFHGRDRGGLCGRGRLPLVHGDR